MIKLAGAALAILIPILFIAALGGIAASAAGGANSTDCTVAGSPTAGVTGYQPDQMTNAATIVAVGSQLGVPEQGWVVAIAAALQESGLRNLDYGDRDSLGLFQQRPSQGWGTPAQVMNPTYAATQFYRHLLAVPNWQQMSVNDAAQAVQRSGTPDAYGPHEQAARAIVGAVQHATCTTNPGTSNAVGDCTHIQAPDPVALTAVNYACGQRGIPYLWGGNGPQDGGFDCSGLTTAAYAAAGLTLPRTAQTQYDRGPPPATRNATRSRRSGVLRHRTQHRYPRWHRQHDRRTPYRGHRTDRQRRPVSRSLATSFRILIDRFRCPIRNSRLRTAAVGREWVDRRSTLRGRVSHAPPAITVPTRNRRAGARISRIGWSGRYHAAGNGAADAQLRKDRARKETGTTST